MGRIPRTDDNVVDIPSNVSVTRGGYVYLNTSTWWGERAGGGGKCAQHTKECIGLALSPGDWRSDRRMWANARYRELFPPDPAGLPERPELSDCVSVGLVTADREIADNIGLTECLDGAYGTDAADEALDLATYMISEESAVMQHFPHWARRHPVSSPASDSSISDFLSRGPIDDTSTELFKRLWARRAIGDGHVFLCYDSTNASSQAEGVFIVQKGHAKDDPDLEQVNTDYAVRQSDGLPVTFTEFPGSVNDVMQAKEVIEFFAKLLLGEDGEDDGVVGCGTLGTDGDDDIEAVPVEVDITAVIDRGYVSEENLRGMVEAGLGFLCLLKRGSTVVEAALADMAPRVRASENYMEELGVYGLTERRRLLSDGTEAYFHAVWDPTLEARHRKALYDRVRLQEGRLAKASKRGTRMTDDELDSYRAHFEVTVREEGTLTVNKRGRGAGGTKEVPAYVVVSFERDHGKITAEDRLCGVYLLASYKEMTAADAKIGYSRRDCVEKVFLALKSHMGMDKYGVHTEAAMHAKAVVWFVASIIYSHIFASTSGLRGNDRKRFTVPAVVRLLEEVEATRDPDDGTYSRRYQLTRAQKDVLRAIGVKAARIDEAIRKIPDLARTARA